MIAVNVVLALTVLNVLFLVTILTISVVSCLTKAMHCLEAPALWSRSTEFIIDPADGIDNRILLRNAALPRMHLCGLFFHGQLYFAERPGQLIAIAITAVGA